MVVSKIFSSRWSKYPAADADEWRHESTWIIIQLFTGNDIDPRRMVVNDGMVCMPYLGFIVPWPRVFFFAAVWDVVFSVIVREIIHHRNGQTVPV